MGEATFEKIKVLDDPIQCRKLLSGQLKIIKESHVIGTLIVRGDVFEIEGKKRRVCLRGVNSVRLHDGKILVVYWPDGQPTIALIEEWGRGGWGPRLNRKLLPRLMEALTPKQLSPRELAVKAERAQLAVRGGATKGRIVKSENLRRLAEESGWPALSFLSSHERITSSVNFGTITKTTTTSFRQNRIPRGQSAWEEWLDQLPPGGEGVRGGIWGGERQEYVAAADFALKFDGA